MKDRPILFSAPMVRAILAGTKAQTRRVVKGHGWEPHHLGHHRLIQHPDPRAGLQAYFRGDGAGDWLGIGCPYGQPGDRLWVRETFFALGRWETRYSAKKGRDEWHFVDMTLECGKAYEYPATGGQPQPMGGARHRGRKTPTWWKRPAIHMPRAASRITLGITSVCVERLQEITRGDAMAEGCPFPNMAAGLDPRDWYRDLWSEINGPDSWPANPWVWVVEFNRVEVA